MSGRPALTPADVVSARAARQAAHERWNLHHEHLTSALVAAAREGVDVGDLLGAAVRTAAKRLDGLHPPGHDGPRDGLTVLLAGRPGSWEAEHVAGLAGGWDR